MSHEVAHALYRTVQSVGFVAFAFADSSHRALILSLIRALLNHKSTDSCVHQSSLVQHGVCHGGSRAQNV